MSTKKAVVLVAWLAASILPAAASTMDMQGSAIPVSNFANSANSELEASRPSAPLQLECSVQYNVVASEDDTFIASAPETVCSIVTPGTVRLEKGTVVVSTRTDSKVTTSAGDVFLKKNAVALVSMQDQKLYVINLSITKEENLSVVVGKNIMFPGVGMQLVVSANRTSYRQVFRNRQVGQQGIATEQIGGTTWITTSNVSLSELVLNETVLVALTRDKECEQGQKLVHRLAKTAAVVIAVVGDRKFSHLKS